MNHNYVADGKAFFEQEIKGERDNLRLPTQRCYQDVCALCMVRVIWQKVSLSLIAIFYEETGEYQW